MALVAAGLLVSTGLIPVVASVSEAAAPPVSQAYGLSAAITLAGVPLITLAPQAGTAYPGGPASMNTAGQSGQLSVGAISTTSNGSDPNGMSDASTSVAGLDLLAGLVTASTVTSSCTSDGGGTTATVNVADLQALGLPVSTPNPAPNTAVVIAGVGTVTLNEQVDTIAGGRYSISVNALDIQLSTAGLITGRVVVGHSQCAADAVAPTVASISPSSGLAAGGDPVTIFGTGFTAATGVSFGSSAAASYVVNSGTQITAASPSGSGTVDVKVSNRTGTSSASAGDQFRYIGRPAVTGLAPSAGPLTSGNVVTITGSGLTGASAVSFGGTAAAGFTVNSATSITATAPAGVAGTVSVSITTAGGVSPNVAADDYTYVAAPAVTALDTSTGPIGGGTIVVITGTSLATTSAVSFGASPATSFHIDGPTQVTAVSPPGSGTVDVLVTTAGGVSPNVAADDFNYVDSPGISAISPSAGPLAGTQVIITGTGFSTATAVNFGSAPATSFTVDNAHQITAIAAPAGAGSVSVRVTGPGGTSQNTSADDFTYTPVPVITTVAPGSGSSGGGSTVVINGTDLGGTTAVVFGNTPATGFTVDSSTQLTAVTPGGSNGTVPVSVTTPGGTSSSGSFTYVTAPVVVAAPVVTGVSPSRGLVAGGTRVTLSGTGFSSAATVNFGTVPGTGLTVVSDTEITVTAPAHDRGEVSVIVAGQGGPSAASSAARYSYLSALDTPVITGLSPIVGPVAGGTRVTITGTGFDDSTTVTFGGLAGSGIVLGAAAEGSAARASAVSDTLTATTPAHAKGPQTVVVTNAAGSDTMAQAFTFIPVLEPVTLTITVPVNGTRTVAPSGESYAQLGVTGCARGTGTVSLSSNHASCVYVAPSTAGTDSFTMAVVDVLGQTAVQTVKVTVTAASTNGGGGGSGGGGGTGGSGTGGGGGAASGGSGSGGGGGGGSSTNSSSSGSGRTGTKAPAGRSAASGTARTASTSADSSALGTSGDKLNTVSGSSPWSLLLALLAGLFLAWLLFFRLWRRRRDERKRDEMTRNHRERTFPALVAGADRRPRQ